MKTFLFLFNVQLHQGCVKTFIFIFNVQLHQGCVKTFLLYLPYSYIKDDVGFMLGGMW